MYLVQRAQPRHSCAAPYMTLLILALLASERPAVLVARIRGGQWGDGSQPPPNPYGQQALPLGYGQQQQPPYMPPQQPPNMPQQPQQYAQQPPPNPYGQRQPPPNAYGQQQQPPNPYGPPNLYGQPPQPQQPQQRAPPPFGTPGSGAPPQYGGGPLQAPIGGAGAPWTPPPELVRIGVRLAAGPMMPAQLDAAALPRLTVETAALLRAKQTAEGTPLLTTFTAIGESAALQQKVPLPLGAIVQPLATLAPPTIASVDGRTPTLARCKACSAYLNAFARVDEHSGRWECNLCGEVNELPLPMPAVPSPSGPDGGGGAGGGGAGGGGFLRGLWGSGGAAGVPSPLPSPEPRADLRHPEVEYILSTAEARQYSAPEVADALSPMREPLAPDTRTLVLALETSAAAYASGAVRAYCDAAVVALESLAASELSGRSGATRVALLTFDEHVHLHFFPPPSSPADATEAAAAAAAEPPPPISHTLPIGVDSETLPTLPKHTPPPLGHLSVALPALRAFLERLAHAAPRSSDASSAAAAAASSEADRAALPSAVNIVLQLLDGMPATLLLCAASGATHGAAKTTRRMPERVGGAPTMPSAIVAGALGPPPTDVDAERAASFERLTRAEATQIRDLARKCLAASVTVHLCLAPARDDAFVDAASLAPLAWVTGGEWLLAEEFGAPTGGRASTAEPATARVSRWVERSIAQRPAGSEGVFRVRTSAGLKVTNLISRETEADSMVLNLPSAQRDTTLALEFAHAPSPSGSAAKDKSTALSADRVFIQTALLYTAPDGGRRIRVLTRPLRVLRDEGTLLRTVHPPAVAALLAKRCAERLATMAASKVAELVQEECAALLLAMRPLCPPPLRRTETEILLTKPLELLPLLSLAILKLPPLAPLLAPGAAREPFHNPDQLAAGLAALVALPAHLVCRALVPSVHVLHLASEGSGWLQDARPPSSPAEIAPSSPPESESSASAASPAPSGPVPDTAPAPVTTRELTMARAVDIQPAGVYLLDGALELILWVGSQAAPSFTRALFGEGGARDGAALLPAESNDETRRLHALLARAREGRPDRGPPLRVLVQGSAEAPRFYGRLLGDGYEPFTLAMHATRVKPKL